MTLHRQVQTDVTAPQLLLTREQIFRPVNDTLVSLRNDETYQFRVRLADLTRGGPPPGDITPGIRNVITTIHFKRRSHPVQVNVV